MKGNRIVYNNMVYMKTNIWRLLVLMTVTLLVTSCSEDEEPEMTLSDIVKTD